MTAPGPAVLGRGVVVADDGAPPPAWDGQPRVVVDEAVLADPAAVVRTLHDHWFHRRPVVVALSVDAAGFRTPVGYQIEPWRLDGRFEAWLDRLHFCVWANNYDARQGEPIWWWGTKAGRLGAVDSDGRADAVLADGRPAWIDGGPRLPLDHDLLDGGVLIHAESVDLGRLTIVPEPVAPGAELADDQRAAVAHGAGPARVVAPAGSGKTRVLTERLRHLLVDRGYEREAVVAVAYNVKARDEMVERCADLGPRVQTLNGLGYQLLRAHLGRAPRVLEEREVRRLVERLAPRSQRRVNTDPTAAYLEGLTAIRLGLRDPAAVEDERDDVPGLASMFGPFRAQLAADGVIDFDEQVYAAVEALLVDGDLRRRAQADHRHLLVDEFQDLTPAHVLMLRLLATPGLDVFGVGDDDQCIYGHAGADPVFLTDYDQFFPGAAAHPLEVNYRCPAAIVDVARKLLANNRRRVPKRIVAGPGAVEDPDALTIRLDPGDRGAAALVEVVKGWLAEPGVDPSGVAVLTRVNSLLLAPHVALSEAGVPLQSALTTEVLARTGVRAALAYLRLATTPGAMAPEDLNEVRRRPSRGFPNWIERWFRRRLDLAGLRQIAERIDDTRVADKVTDLADDLERLAEVAAGGTTADVLVAVRDEVGLGAAMEQLDRTRGGQGTSQLDDLEALLQVAALHPVPATFEGWLRASFHREATAGGVTLSTIHRVKGREWDRVALFGVSDGVVPHRLAVDPEEERRVLHVGITRARRAVAVLGDRARPSPFIAELRGEAPPAPPAPAARPPAPSKPPDDGGVEAALRTWRLERSRADEVPAYVVASNATIAAIAERRPSTLQELGRVPGIGPAKLERYGEEILSVVTASR